MSVPPDQVNAQLDRILASPGFASAERASRFLRYIVERTVAGEGDQLKEYVVGRAVFDRGDDYDPRTDSIVRVEAGRLRSKIDEYYAGPGRGDAILIQLRRGGYAPSFEVRAQSPGTSPRTSPRTSLSTSLKLLAVAAGIALVAWGASMWRRPASPAETIAVLPFASYSTNPDEHMLAARVTDGVTAELARLGTLGVVSHTSALQFADVRPSLREIANTLNAQFILEGKVRDDGGHLTIQIVLVNASIDRKMFVHDVQGRLADVPDMQRQLAKAASAAILERKR